MSDHNTQSAHDFPPDWGKEFMADPLSEYLVEQGQQPPNKAAVLVQLLKLRTAMPAPMNASLNAALQHEDEACTWSSVFWSAWAVAGCLGQSWWLLNLLDDSLAIAQQRSSDPMDQKALSVFRFWLKRWIEPHNGCSRQLLERHLSDPFSRLRVSELRAMARAHGMKRLARKARKAELVGAMRQFLSYGPAADARAASKDFPG